FADLGGRRYHHNRVDDAQLSQVANVIIAQWQVEAGRTSRSRSQGQVGQQESRCLVAEFVVGLHVQMVVFVALPGVHGSAESRHQVGSGHAEVSLQSVDGCLKWPKKPQKSTLFAL